jgi:nucleoside-diphosphate-sugar epimerase
LPEIIENNLRALYQVYEGARRHRVRRVVFASSNHNTGAERLGYRPRQNAEDYAPEILNRANPLDAIRQRHQGGSYAAFDYTPPEQRPAARPNKTPEGTQTAG